MKTGFRTGQVLTVAGGHFVHDVFTSFLAPWLPLLIAKLGLSLTLAGSLTVFLRLPSLFTPFIGVLADRIDMRYMVILTPALTAVSMSLVGAAPSYGMVCLLLTVAGFSAAVLHVPAPVMVARASGSYVGRGMGLFMAAGELARTVGPLVAVGAVSVWGFEGSYRMMTLGLFASGALYWKLRRPAVQDAARSKSSVLKTWRAMKHVLIPLTGLVFARTLMVASLAAFLPTFIVARGGSLWFGGAALAVLELAGVLGTAMSGAISDRVGRRFILLGAMVASPVLMLLFLFSPDWAVFPCLTALGMAVFAPAPVMLALVQDYAHGMQASANGIYMGVNFIVASGITILVGWSGDLFGLREALAGSAVCAFLGVPAVYLLPGHLTYRSTTAHPPA